MGILIDSQTIYVPSLSKFFRFDWLTGENIIEPLYIVKYEYLNCEGKAYTTDFIDFGGAPLADKQKYYFLIPFEYAQPSGTIIKNFVMDAWDSEMPLCFSHRYNGGECENDPEGSHLEAHSITEIVAPSVTLRDIVNSCERRN